jgi:hypothetical protein
VSGGLAAAGGLGFWLVWAPATVDVRVAPVHGAYTAPRARIGADEPCRAASRAPAQPAAPVPAGAPAAIPEPEALPEPAALREPSALAAPAPRTRTRAATQRPTPPRPTRRPTRPQIRRPTPCSMRNPTHRLRSPAACCSSPRARRDR